MLVFRSSYAVKCSYTVKYYQGKNFALLDMVSPVLRIVPGTCSENIFEYRVEVYIGCKPILDASYCQSACIYI